MIKTYHNDEELFKMSFNSFKMTERIKRKRAITKHDVYVPKRHANKHKLKRLIGHG